MNNFKCVPHSFLVNHLKWPVKIVYNEPSHPSPPFATFISCSLGQLVRQPLIQLLGYFILCIPLYSSDSGSDIVILRAGDLRWLNLIIWRNRTAQPGPYWSLRKQSSLFRQNLNTLSSFPFIDFWVVMETPVNTNDIIARHTTFWVFSPIHTCVWVRERQRLCEMLYRLQSLSMLYPSTPPPTDRWTDGLNHCSCSRIILTRIDYPT